MRDHGTSYSFLGKAEAIINVQLIVPDKIMVWAKAWWQTTITLTDVNWL